MEKINIEYIKEKLKNSYDVKYREIECEMGIIFGVFIDDLCDSKFISEYIFNPLIQTQNYKCRFRVYKKRSIAS